MADVSTSIIICTAGRGEALVECAIAVLKEADKATELLIVDQSAEAAVGLPDDARLRYMHVPFRGKSRAMNHGLREARGELVLSTDDDCEPEHGWLQSIARAFQDHPKAAVAYCNVLPGPYDDSAGFVPAYSSTTDAVYCTVRDFCVPHGIGAGIAMRRSVVMELGGFDESLGPGSKFADYEDSDLAIRALLSGYEVLHISTANVIHHGFRTWEQGKALAKRNWLGIGAGQAKLLKCGKWGAIRLATYDIGNHVLKPIVGSLIKLRKPAGITRGVYYVRGFLGALRSPVDRERLLFKG